MPASPDLAQRDFNGLPPLNFVFQTLGSDLTANAANVGKIYIVGGRLRYHKNSTTIINLDIAGVIADADIAAAAGIQLSKLAVNPVARANHTGTQLASTISDLATAVLAFRLDQFAAATAPISGVDPTVAAHLATKNYTDNAIQNAINGQDWKPSVKAATTGNITLSGTQTVDGHALVAGDRVLVKDQTTGSQNGIYVVSAGAWTRATDADNSGSTSEVTNGMTVPVEGGTGVNDGTLWILTTTGAITLGTTALTFSQVGGAGATYTAGTGITLTGNTFSLTVPVTVALGGTGATTAAGARTNLGVARAGAVVAQNAALTAGTEAAFPHGTGTANGIPSARLVSTKETVFIKLRCDATNIYVTADVAVGSGTLEFLYLPVD